MDTEKSGRVLGTEKILGGGRNLVYTLKIIIIKTFKVTTAIGE